MGLAHRAAMSAVVAVAIALPGAVLATSFGLVHAGAVAAATPLAVLSHLLVAGNVAGGAAALLHLVRGRGDD